MTENATTDKTVPLLLNIEAATGICSVCISRGMELLSKHDSTEPNEHSKIITLLIQRCVEDAGIELGDLDAVALSEGPGSYTSLRVGFSTAKGICYALNKPLITVSTLAALARAAYLDAQDDRALYCPMIDARRMEVYTALFRSDGEVVLPPKPLIVDQFSFEEYFGSDQRIVFCGDGAEKCKKFFNNNFSSFSKVKNCSSVHLISDAMNMFFNKNFSDTAYATPLYLKAPNITSSRQKPS